MKKYFCVSDIHSFFYPFLDALTSVGFDKDNPEHILIVDGDLFDRGDDSYELYQYIRSIPKERCILVRGNHERLFLDMIKSKRVKEVDESNGTAETFIDIAKVGHEKEFEWVDSFDLYWANWGKQLFKRTLRTNQNIKEFVKWLKSDEWLDYFELGQFIFEHSFIPLHNIGDIDIYYQYPSYKFMEAFGSWRSKATAKEKFDSRWGAPHYLYKKGFFEKEAKKGKVLVVGHWHTSDFYETLKPEMYVGEKGWAIKDTCPIFLSDHFIGLDACTVRTGRVNCLVIDETEKGYEINYDQTLYKPSEN